MNLCEANNLIIGNAILSQMRIIARFGYHETVLLRTRKNMCVAQRTSQGHQLGVAVKIDTMSFSDKHLVVSRLKLLPKRET